jgi:oxygen-independent coproporphyrinogen-3 oxidase
MRAEHLYVHVPFCARRCVYCDFSIAVRARVPVDDFVSALDREWAGRHASTDAHLKTVYLGGGTPSKLGGEGISRVIGVVADVASIEADAEITLEANPEDVSPEVARDWQRAGVNRVSLGVQTFSEAALRWMHRTHDAEQARGAVQVLLDAGIANISIDLIFALPTEVERSWEEDVREALSLGVTHLSLYGLTVEPRTPLGRWVARKSTFEAPEDLFEQEFLLADNQLRHAGFDHYEVSNYGLPGHHSRHNWAYWRRIPYIGLGPSAHEFDGTTRRWNDEAYERWLTRAVAGEDPRAGAEQLTYAERTAEETYLGLRTTRGVRLSSEESAQARPWIDAGWGGLDGTGTFKLTALGWLRLDSIASALTALRSRY